MSAHDHTPGATRREFIATTATGAGLFMIGASRNSAAQDRPLRAGLVGCGRRGVGAALDFLNADPNVTLVAACDVFEDNLKKGRKKLEPFGERVKLNDGNCFTGFDGYKHVIAQDLDVVLLCTPPSFRAAQLRSAVDAGRHVFSEKPAGTDPAQCRNVIESGAIAEQKGLSIVCGTQRRHQVQYRDLVPRIKDGAIGEILAAEVYWVGDYGYYPAVKKEDGWSDMEGQLRNWNYFTWLSGDHIVEQHVHNIDIMSWVLGPPTKAFGLGGRQQRTGPEFGHIYDHFSVEFEYENGVRVQSLCRQNSDTYSRVAERFVGTLGTCDPRRAITGKNVYEWKGEDANPYVDEHKHLITAIRTGKPINEAKQLAESTLAAIMGRMACYTGQEVTWDFVVNESKEDLLPKLALGDLETPPVAVPGVTKLV